MKLLKWIPALLACSFVLLGCEDDDEETTYYYLDGSITLEMPSYVKAGETFTFKRSEISTLCADGIDESEVGYYVVDPYESTNDTLDLNWTEFTFKVLEDLGSFTLTVKGFYSGYVNSSGAASFTTVNPEMPGGSVSDTGIGILDPCVTDARDGKKYYYAEIGDLLWFRHNLAYEGCGVPYGSAPAMSDLFGIFYTQQEAMEACPEGWRLPTEAEWNAVYEEFGSNAGKLKANAYFNDEPMWSYWKDVDCDNESTLAILPVGYANPGQDDSYTFYSLDEYAALWTSDTQDDMAVYVYLYEKDNKLYRNVQSADIFRLPVRCVKNN